MMTDKQFHIIRNQLTWIVILLLLIVANQYCDFGKTGLAEMIGVASVYLAALFGVIMVFRAILFDGKAENDESN